MSDVKVNDVEDKNKVEKEAISSDESRDVEKDSDSDAEVKKEAPKPPKKEASKAPKKEKEKTTNRQTPKKKSKAENEDTKSSGSNSSEKKVEEDDDCEADGDEEEEGADKKKPLLDQPLEMHGARERKKVERLAISFNVPAKDKKLDIPEGEGEKLGDIPIIDFRLHKFKSEELKFFHRVLFNRAGQAAEIKRNIRRFSGFGFKPDSEEYEKKKGHLDKGNLVSLKQICEILDIERSGSKDDLITRILDFLVMPKSTGKKVPVAKGKPTRSSSRAKTPAKKPTGRSSTRRSNRSRATVDDSKSESSNLDDDEEEEEQEQEQEEEEEEEMNDKDEEKSIEKNSDDSEEEIVKPPKKEVKNKMPAKKEEKKAEKKEVKKPAPKSSNKRKKAEPSDEESSDDEPLAKKTKHPPTDVELKALIEKILDGANLEEITMKTVCKQVYGTFPEFDLSDRKDFIKKTVKSIIS